MVKKISILLFIISIGNTYAQTENFVRKGLLRATSTLSPGKYLYTPAPILCSTCYRTNPYIYPTTNIVFLNGETEYFVEDKISIRGEFYYALKNSNYVFSNSQILFGGVYHFSFGKLDLNIGLQPGVMLVDQLFTGPKLLPTLGAFTGANYYVWDYFHFFGNLRYIKATNNDNSYSPKLDQIVFSAGLGFQLHTRKK